MILLTHYLILKSLRRNGIIEPATKLEIVMGIHSGSFVNANGIRTNKAIPLARLVFKAKLAGSRNSLPFKNSLAENQPRSNIFPPDFNNRT